MAKRTVIRGKGIPEHTNPIPPAARVGNLVCSSAIMGYDPQTHKIPDDKALEIRHAFENLGRIIGRAGGSPADIAKLTVYLRSRDDRKLVNPHWLAMFPDEDDRPARHTQVADLPAGSNIQLDFIALLDDK